MAPRALWAMRHAEKTGDLDDPHLSLLGQRRAAALVAWIPLYLGRPDMIFASAVSQHSQRPIETVQPLADALGLEINDSFADQDYGALAKAILTEERFDGRTILVCWHHGNIPNFLHALGALDGAIPTPGVAMYLPDPDGGFSAGTAADHRIEGGGYCALVRNR